MSETQMKKWKKKSNLGESHMEEEETKRIHDTREHEVLLISFDIAHNLSDRSKEINDERKARCQHLMARCLCLDERDEKLGMRCMKGGGGFK